MVGLQLFDGQPRSFDRGWCDGMKKRVGNGLLDHHPADGETVHATAVDQIFAAAVITRRGVPAAIVNMQTAAAVSTRDDALQ